jgi:hypothetical protein
VVISPRFSEICARVNLGYMTSERIRLYDEKDRSASAAGCWLWLTLNLFLRARLQEVAEKRGSVSGYRFSDTTIPLNPSLL